VIVLTRAVSEEALELLPARMPRAP